MRCVARNALFYPIKTRSNVTTESRFTCQNLSVCHTIFYTFLGLLWRPYQRSKENNCKSTPNSKNDETSIFLMFSGRKRCVAHNSRLYPIKINSEVTIESHFKCQNLFRRPYHRIDSKENNCKSTPNIKNDENVHFPDV